MVKGEKMKIVKAPKSYYVEDGKWQVVVFLAGSIEMGAAENWQDKLCKGLKGDYLVLNPRRNNWDSSWEQSITNSQFREQVKWELNAMERADIITMYFDPNTKSPITLLELGLWAGKNPKKLIVCCPDSYWRKGNVDILCAKYGVRQVSSIDEIIGYLSVIKGQ